MANGKNRFCIDIDNVIARTDEVIRKIIREFTKERVCLAYEDIKRFNYTECRDAHGHQITESEWQQVHILFSQPDELAAVLPMTGAESALRALEEYGGIHFATSRLPKARKATVEWLETHKFPEHNLHFLKHGKKHEVLKGFTAAIEDDYDQAVEFATV
jgi:uncharacterized HAD superfamily protein